MVAEPDHRPGPGRWWARGLLAGCLALGAFVTLRPEPMGRFSRPITRAVMEAIDQPWSVAFPLVERGGNVLLFVPLALLLCWSLPRWPRWAVWLACVAGSVGIELVQALFLPARYPSLVDIGTNSTGAAIGVGLHWLLTRRR
ncbi:MULTISPECIES: VanZ family protein [unclassified Modestobacter]|uniref:VanZ family protein n=1 Tax=unclassified Modestobacter TaxID=2643866 RepID=UPI0022AB4D6B|nr:MULTISPECIES: VanZ family protein [unclassified Modestobacter]MCZ2825387.1 VanZ family protein [Modestobacter sp. VKM Ac-2981]MCZ2853548.1 VanZ family protein [Modestobacter sp. VKM Ac-2982]